MSEARKEASPENAATWRTRERGKALARFGRELDRLREQLDRDMAFVYEATVYEDAAAVWADEQAVAAGAGDPPEHSRAGDRLPAPSDALKLAIDLIRVDHWPPDNDQQCSCGRYTCELRQFWMEQAGVVSTKFPARAVRHTKWVAITH